MEQPEAATEPTECLSKFMALKVAVHNVDADEEQFVTKSDELTNDIKVFLRIWRAIDKFLTHVDEM